MSSKSTLPQTAKPEKDASRRACSGWTDIILDWPSMTKAEGNDRGKKEHN